MRRFRSGFTLIELLLCIAIIGLLLSAVSLPFSAIVRRSRLQQGTDLVIGVLRDAQVRAFRDGTPWRVSVSLDGRALHLASATATFGVEWNCTTSSWTTPEITTLPPGVSIGLRTESCIIYGSNGRVLNGGPWVPEPSATPPNGMSSIIVLTDGHHLSDNELKNFFNYVDPGIVSWQPRNIPTLYVNLRHSRYVEMLRIGFVAQKDGNLKVNYPTPATGIIVRGTTAEAPTDQDFTIDFLQGVPVAERPSLPPNPTNSSGASRAWLTFPVNREIRHVRVQFPSSTVTNRYWALDEIDFGPRFFQVKFGDQHRYVDINPTTGRVKDRDAKQM